MQEIDLKTVKPDLKKILVIGHEGVGKTNFIKTMPKPIYLFSFDKGYQTLAGEEGITVGLCMDEDRRQPKAYMEFVAKFDALQKGLKYKHPDGREEAYRTIALDSISFLSTLLFDHECRVQNLVDKRGEGGSMYGLYGVVKSKTRDMINKAILAAEYVVCTALLDTDKDEDTGELFFVPSMVGSAKNEVGAWFDMVLFMSTDKNAATGGVSYRATWIGDRRQRAKMRIPSSYHRSAAFIENPTYPGILKFFGIDDKSNQPTK